MTDRLPEALRAFAARPLSEVEWEDLLYRIELMTRVVRVQLEEVGTEAPAVTATLDALIEREEFAQALLDAATGEGAHRQVDPSRDFFQPPDIAGDRVDRFVRLRARTFAMAQRRGIDLWDRSALLTDGGSVTVHQIFAFLASSDATSLAELRAVVGRTPVC